MHPAKLRRIAGSLLVLLVLSLPMYAKRRAVTQRPVPPIHTINGVIHDAVTGAPVIAAAVSAGNRDGATNAQGTFELKFVTGSSSFQFVAERSGYQTFTKLIGPNDTFLDIRMTPTPTVSIRQTNGQTVQVDYESLKFGYPVPFSGYRDNTSDEFCRLDQAQPNEFIYDKSQMRKLTGPAQVVPAGGCCEGNAWKMNLTLKSGESLDVLFRDTCQERYRVDVGARDHVTGQFVHIVLTDIAEMVFP